MLEPHEVQACRVVALQRSANGLQFRYFAHIAPFFYASGLWFRYITRKTSFTARFGEIAESESRLESNMPIFAQIAESESLSPVRSLTCQLSRT